MEMPKSPLPYYNKTRKMIFEIDDYEYFRRVYNVEPTKLDDVKQFKCTCIYYTFYSQIYDKSIFYGYELYDENGNKIEGRLTNYQKYVLKDCDNYFRGKEPQNEHGYMFISITEEEVDSVFD